MEDSSKEVVISVCWFQRKLLFLEGPLPRFRSTEIPDVGKKTVVSWGESVIASIGEFNAGVLVCEEEGVLAC